MPTFEETPQVIFEAVEATDFYFKIDDDGKAIFIATEGQQVIYRDAIQAIDIAGKTLNDLQQMSQIRYDDWLIVSTTPTESIEPPVEG